MGFLTGLTNWLSDRDPTYPFTGGMGGTSSGAGAKGSWVTQEEGASPVYYYPPIQQVILPMRLTGEIWYPSLSFNFEQQGEGFFVAPTRGHICDLMWASAFWVWALDPPTYYRRREEFISYGGICPHCGVIHEFRDWQPIENHWVLGGYRIDVGIYAGFLLVPHFAAIEATLPDNTTTDVMISEFSGGSAAARCWIGLARDWTIEYPKGHDIIPKPIPFPMPLLFTDNQKRKKAMSALRLKLEFKPYEVMCNGEKILCDGQQITCGDVE